MLPRTAGPAKLPRCRRQRWQAQRYARPHAGRSPKTTADGHLHSGFGEKQQPLPRLSIPSTRMGRRAGPRRAGLGGGGGEGAGLRPGEGSSPSPPLRPLPPDGKTTRWWEGGGGRGRRGGRGGDLVEAVQVGGGGEGAAREGLPGILQASVGRRPQVRQQRPRVLLPQHRYQIVVEALRPGGPPPLTARPSWGGSEGWQPTLVALPHRPAHHPALELGLQGLLRKCLGSGSRRWAEERNGGRKGSFLLKPACLVVHERDVGPMHANMHKCMHARA